MRRHRRLSGNFLFALGHERVPWTTGRLSIRVLNVRFRENGSYELMVRARDGSGEVQVASPAPSFPSGAAGYHKVGVVGEPVGKAPASRFWREGHIDQAQPMAPAGGSIVIGASKS